MNSGFTPTGTKTPVRILRGRYRGREGWISGTLADRQSRGVTKAIVKIAGEDAELLDTSSLRELAQLELGLCAEDGRQRAPFADKPSQRV